MFIPKKYGQSKIDKCPFCQKQATTMNKQGIPVCLHHKDEHLDGLKCICGSNLDILNGKFGIFFSCINCGSMNLKRVMEFNKISTKTNNQKENYQQKNEKFPNKKTITTVRSDDPRYFD